MKVRLQGLPFPILSAEFIRKVSMTFQRFVELALAKELTTKRKGKRMAATKVYLVKVRKQKAGGFEWFPMDAQGRVRLAGGRKDYGRRHDAVRGARRACGVNVRIVHG